MRTRTIQCWNESKQKQLPESTHGSIKNTHVEKDDQSTWNPSPTNTI